MTPSLRELRFLPTKLDETNREGNALDISIRDSLARLTNE